MRLLLVASPAFYNRNRNGIGSSYNGGGWMFTLQKELMNREDIELALCFRSDDKPLGLEIQDGVSYYHFPLHRKSIKDKITDLLNYKDDTREEKVWSFYLENFKCIIDDFHPDVIEVFGTETYNSLLPLVDGDIPLVLHIQGLLSLYIYSLLPLGVSWWQYIWQDHNFMAAFSRFQELVCWKRNCHMEKAILRSCKHLIGRTEWDRQAASIIAPKSVYHYGGEILRPEFYEPVNRKLPLKLRIVTTISQPLYKGYDVLLKTADVLKNVVGIEFEWLVFGNVKPNFIERNTNIKHEDVYVKLCGVVSPQKLRNTLLESTLYFHPSYIENSSNSIAEAQILSIPVVAASVGGNGTMVKHGETGFLFPINDPYIAAFYINQLSKNTDMNIKIGNKAREVAIIRHDKDDIMNSLIETYRNIIKMENSNKAAKRIISW